MHSDRRQGGNGEMCAISIQLVVRSQYPNIPLHNSGHDHSSPFFEESSLPSLCVASHNTYPLTFQSEWEDVSLHTPIESRELGRDSSNVMIRLFATARVQFKSI